MSMKKCCQTGFPCVEISDRFVGEIRNFLDKLDCIQHYNVNVNSKHDEGSGFGVLAWKFKASGKVQVTF